MISVGVPISKLRAHAPRGVVRVARAITERLALVDNVQLLAVSDPFYSSNQILLECWPMDEWLEQHPMAIAMPAISSGAGTPPIVYRAWVHYLVKFLAVLHLRAVARRLVRSTQPARRAMKTTLRTTFDRFGLGLPARHLWRLALRCAYQSSPSLAPALHAAAPVLSTMVDERMAAAPHVVCPWPADNDEPLAARGYVALQDLDVILSFECFDAIWDWPLELYPCKAVGVFHDAIPFRINEGRHADPGGYYRAVGKMVARASLITCDSISSQKDLHAFFPTAAEKTRVVYLGHDRNRFAPRKGNPAKRPRIGAAARLPPGEEPKSGGQTGPCVDDPKKPRRKLRRIAMIGDVEPRKNQAAVLRACRFLARLRPQDRLRLVIIGQVPNPNPYSELERQARRFAQVEWLGYVPDEEIGDILRSCDAFVYASLWEGFGIPLLEAMSAGVPVVCSQNSSLPEVAGDAAFYCDPYDPASIASSIDKALSLSRQERTAWIRRARQRAATFRWSPAAGRFLDVIQAVTGGQLPTTSKEIASDHVLLARHDEQSLQRAA